MSRRTVVVHDARLAGTAPKKQDWTVVCVNEKTPLAELVQVLSGLALKYGEIEVRIMCHGYEVNGRGGYGLELCAEGLTLSTVKQLAPLNGKLSYSIIIFSCSAADVSPGKGAAGNGRLLCAEIARNTGTGVFAADATQVYRCLQIGSWALWPIDWGGWEGNVLEFNAAGKMEAKPRIPRT